MHTGNILSSHEAIRLIGLGLLMAGPMAYEDLASKIRFIVTRVVGQSLDLLGSSLEILHLEGLVTKEPSTLTSSENLILTDNGRHAFHKLMESDIKVPLDDVSRLVLSLKLMFWHHLDAPEKEDQLDILLALFENEIARLEDLKKDVQATVLSDWLTLEIAQLRVRKDWLADLEKSVNLRR